MKIKTLALITSFTVLFATISNAGFNISVGVYSPMPYVAYVPPVCAPVYVPTPCYTAPTPVYYGVTYSSGYNTHRMPRSSYQSGCVAVPNIVMRMNPNGSYYYERHVSHSRY